MLYGYERRPSTVQLAKHAGTHKLAAPHCECPAPDLRIDLCYTLQVQLPGMEVKYIFAAPEATPEPLYGGCHSCKVILQCKYTVDSGMQAAI